MQKCEHCLNHLLPPRKNNVIALRPRGSWVPVAYLHYYELHRRSFVVRCLFNFFNWLICMFTLTVYTVVYISSFKHVRLSLDNKRLLTYLLTERQGVYTKCWLCLEWLRSRSAWWSRDLEAWRRWPWHDLVSGWCNRDASVRWNRSRQICQEWRVHDAVTPLLIALFHEQFTESVDPLAHFSSFIAPIHV